MTYETLGSLVFEFARNSTILYSGMISIICALILGLMVSWRNIRHIGIVMFPMAVIPVLIGFKPNAVVLLFFGLLFVVSAWLDDDYNIQSMGLKEMPIFNNR